MAQIDNYKWLELIPPGWIDLAQKMIEECETIEPNFELIDLKEKWGMIRMFSYPYTEQIAKIEHKYEQLSSQICCKCGKPATKLSTGWILPWCDKCSQDEEKYYKRFK